MTKSNGFILYCMQCGGVDTSVSGDFDADIELTCNTCDQVQHDLGIKFPDPLPPDGFYYVTSERASTTPIIQIMGSAIYCFNEVGTITMKQLEERGWKIAAQVPTFHKVNHD